MLERQTDRQTEREEERAGERELQHIETCLLFTLIFRLFFLNHPSRTLSIFSTVSVENWTHQVEVISTSKLNTYITCTRTLLLYITSKARQTDSYFVSVCTLIVIRTSYTQSWQTELQMELCVCVCVQSFKKEKFIYKHTQAKIVRNHDMV